MFVLVGGLAASILACSGSLAEDDYEQGCKRNDDCVTVRTGDLCDCACEFGAISKGAIPRYESDSFSARKSCDNDCAPCKEAPAAVCKDGTCAVP
jgi:hypothetical protein